MSLWLDPRVMSLIKMSENIFESHNEEDPNEKNWRKLEADGWERAGEIEYTHTTPLNPETGRFEPKEFRTAEDIKKQYLEKYRQQGFNEVKIVHRRVLKEKLGWDPYSYYVYLRKGGE